jgi:ryanodine receptor 2
LNRKQAQGLEQLLTVWLQLAVFQEQEMEKQKLLFHQARLANRGVAEMVLLHISACKGVPSDMVMKTLQLGIAILRGGNVDIQMVNLIFF